MAIFSDAEIRGDHSNLKGGYYHLLYLLWRLVKFPGQRIAFFQGNDLLGTGLVAPPNPELIGTQTAFSKVEGDHCDVWCQLKNTKHAWTVSEILGDNLLSNFIANSFASEQRQRSWRMELVTTAEIRSQDLREFTIEFEKSRGAGHGSNTIRLNSILDDAVAMFAQSSCKAKPTRGELIERACRIIRECADVEPLSVRTVQAELRIELLIATGDVQIAREVEDRLIGAVTQDAAGGPNCARWYDLSWFRDVTGLDLQGDKPLDRSIRNACNSQVQSQRPRSFDETLFVQREETQAILNDFLNSKKTCLILMGRSGTGKTWGLFYWANHTLKDRARLLMTGEHLQISDAVSSIIANVLRPLTSQTAISEAALVQKLMLPSRAREFGPPVLVLDDLQPPSVQIETYRTELRRLVSACNSMGLKLVISCQTERAIGLAPFVDMPSDLLFQPNDEGRSRAQQNDKRTFEFTDFVDRELRLAVSSRMASGASERYSHRAMAPIFRHIRNPFLLDQLLQGRPERITSHSSSDPEKFAETWFKERTAAIIDRLRFDCQIDETSANIAIAAMFKSIWLQRGLGATRPVMERDISVEVPGFGPRVVDSLMRRGTISAGHFLAIDEPQLAAYGLAHWLKQHKSCEETLEELAIETDTDVLAVWLKLYDRPSDLASILIAKSANWRAPVAHALSRCNTDDESTVAALVGLARHEAEDLPGVDAAEALGNYALRSRKARKWLGVLLVSHDDASSRAAQYALWHMARFVPARVSRIVRFAVGKLGLKELSGDKNRKHRQKLARIIRPLRNINSQYAGDTVLSTLAPLATFATSAYTEASSDEAFGELWNDPFVEEFDELQTVAAFHADRHLFGVICDRLRSEDCIQRLRSANGIAALGREASVEVGPLLAEAITVETNYIIATRMIWHLVGYAEIDPHSVMSALARCPVNDWTDYGVSATVLSLFEWIGRKFETMPAPTFPNTVLPDDEERSRILEIQLVALEPFLNRDEAIATQQKRLVDSIEEYDSSISLLCLFRFRAIAVARLLKQARQCGVNDSPQILRSEIPNGSGAFFFLQLDPWIEQHATALFEKSDLIELITPLIKSINAFKNGGLAVTDSWRRNATFMMTRDSIDVLARCLNGLPNPVQFLNQLPRDWEALYAARRMLALGNHSRPIVDFAQSECSSHEKSATAQASDDRIKCLIELRKAGVTTDITFEPSFISGFFRGSLSAAEELSAEADRRPAEVLSVLDDLIRSPIDGLLTLEWAHTARSVPAVILSYVFARCADPMPLSLRESRHLIDELLRLIESLPESESTKEWHRVYRQIQSGANPTEHPTSQSTHPNPIRESHNLALRILETGGTTQAASALIADRRGWWETQSYKRNDGSSD